MRRWGAVYILLLLFIGSFTGQAIVAIPLEGGRAFWAEVLANHQSEWLQLILQAVLLLGAKHWLFQVDAEDLERIERKVDTIDAAVERIELRQANSR